MKNSIISLLKKFNRKERFYLVGYALGNEEFRLSENVQKELSDHFGISIPIDAFVAMDYHLDWLYASLFLSVEENQNHLYKRAPETITANQEDIDLLVAFEIEGKTHLLLLEAKGVMSFDNKQLQSKIKRFDNIFNDQVVKRSTVIPHFAIISPYQPSKIDLSFFPEWMKKNGSLVWIELNHLKKKVDQGELLKIIRCDENKKPSKIGSHWMVEAEK